MHPLQSLGHKAQGSWSFPCGIQILSAVVHPLYTARYGAAEAIRMLGVLLSVKTHTNAALLQETMMTSDVCFKIISFQFFVFCFVVILSADYFSLAFHVDIQI